MKTYQSVNSKVKCDDEESKIVKTQGREMIDIDFSDPEYNNRVKTQPPGGALLIEDAREESEKTNPSGESIDLDFFVPPLAPGFDRYPNWYLIELAKNINLENLDKVILEGIRRVVENPTLKWVLEGITEACTDRLKDKIQQQFVAAAQQKNIESKEQSLDWMHGSSLFSFRQAMKEFENPESEVKHNESRSFVD